MSNFAEYEPDAGRQVPDTPIEIRPMGADDLDACAELIVSRTGGPVAERRSRLLSDLQRSDPLLRRRVRRD